MSDWYMEYMKRQSKRNKLERKLDEYNHTMELIRTIIPIVIITLQLIILWKIG
jgi:heme/copper-type cytochrome/quinol oxidase subunit 2